MVIVTLMVSASGTCGIPFSGLATYLVRRVPARRGGAPTQGVDAANVPGCVLSPNEIKNDRQAEQEEPSHERNHSGMRIAPGSGAQPK